MHWLKCFLVYVLIIISFVFFTSGQTARADTGSGIILYTVQQGDSLWFISQRFGGTVAEIRQLNGLAGDELFPGQVLYMPVIKESTYYKYTVQQGDTLYLISLRLGRSVKAIKTVNSLLGDIIYPGQVLSIPLNRSGNTVYQVKPGDSLFLIAHRHNMTVNELIRMNNLPSDLIMVGQLLEVPLKNISEPELIVYRVVAGDTLSTIAQKFKTTVNAIYRTNNLNSDVLMPGQPLYIAVNSVEPVKVSGPRGEQKPGYGELLEWEWGRWIYNVGAIATVNDLESGLSFQIKHLGGSNHADSEPLTKNDTVVMKQIFGGRWSWSSRPVMLKVGNRVLAASISGQPHGVESIKNNDFPGHFDLYLWNSRSHNTNELQPQHQANVLKAAGMNQAP